MQQEDQAIARADKNTYNFPAEAGEMGKLIAEYNWSATPLGPIETWPQSLRTCVHIMLSSRQPIWIGWGKELIKLYNDPYRSIVGGKHPWALGKPASVVWQDIWRDIDPMLKQVMEQGRGTYVESQLLIMERNGYAEETYYTFSYTPVPDADGNIAGMFCANTDNTERIINERQLKTLTELGKKLVDCKTRSEVVKKSMSTLAENAHDFPFSIFRILEGDKAILVNPESLGELANIIPGVIDLSEDKGIVPDAIRESIATRQIQVFTEPDDRMGRMPKGAWGVSPEQAIMLPIIQTGSKEPIGVFTIGLNPYRLMDEKYRSFFQLVADQIANSLADVNAFEQERKRAEALAEIDRAKTAFFSNISHELRTPLTLMLAPMEDALNDPSTVEENKQRLDIANRNAKRLLKLVNTLLDFSRIEAGRMNANFERVNLADLTKDLTGIFRAAIERAGMELKVACDAGIEGWVDTDMWEKIVLNLLSNAFKYTHSGTITVQLKQDDGEVKLSVSDTGIGIPEQELGKVFERFHRVQNDGGRSQEGTGIGLSLVQELVRLHGGTISVESTIGEGSVFHVTIPRGHAHLQSGVVADKATTSRVPRSNTYIEEALKWLPDADMGQQADDLDLPDTISYQQQTDKPKVLIADDNTDMRTYLQRLLEKTYEVTAVNNGRAALQKAQELLPDLILSDVMMPELNGFELVKCLKETFDTRNIPIILLSARAGEEATIEGLATGADDYMVKPFSGRELLSRIDSNIKIAQSRIHAARQLYNLFMNAPVAIAILRGAEQRFELANEKYLELAGKTSVLGKTLEEAFPELIDKGITELLDGVYKNSTPFFGNEFEVDLVRGGKKEHLFLNFVYTPLREVDGTTSGVMVIVMDVTDMVKARKAIEENEARLEKEVEQRTGELQATNEALERSNRELEQYAYVTSHDLQEPLRKIQIFNNMLIEEHSDKLEARGIRCTEKIAESAQRMTELIRELLEFSRLSQASPQFEKVDLNETLKGVLKDLEVVITQQHALIEATSLCTIEGVPLQISQMFHNIISNALKFSKADVQPVIKITTEVIKDGHLQYPELKAGTSYCKMVIRDNGIGFNQEYAHKIFTIFQRLNDRSQFSGHGIGLAICKRVVDNHGGIIFAEGKEGEGASFTIILPVNQV